MTNLFVDATSVLRVDDATHGTVDHTGPDPGLTTGDAVFAARVHDGWDIGGHANGGYLLALAGRAMAETVGRPPLTLTAHYLRPAPAGPCEITVSTVRAGRRLATATGLMSMEGRPVLQLVGTFGNQAPGGPSVVVDTPIDLPPYDESASPPSPTEGPLPAVMERLAIRLRPGDEGFRRGEPSGRPEMYGWFAFADHQPVDAFGLLFAADAFPPAVFNSELPMAWVPTVELTVHVRGTPAPGPLRCAFRSRDIHDGLLDEEGEIWDSTGALVAQSRQLALVPR